MSDSFDSYRTPSREVYEDQNHQQGNTLDSSRQGSHTGNNDSHGESYGYDDNSYYG